MAYSDTENGSVDRPGFPFVTASAALGVLFVFLFLMWLAARKDNPLEPQKSETTETKTEPKPDAATLLAETKARNEAALNGVGAKMSRDEAHSKLLSTLKGPKDNLPFPTPEQPVPVPKKDEKKDEKKSEKKDKQEEKP